MKPETNTQVGRIFMSLPKAWRIVYYGHRMFEPMEIAVVDFWIWGDYDP